MLLRVNIQLLYTNIYKFVYTCYIYKYNYKPLYFRDHKDFRANSDNLTITITVKMFTILV